MGCRGWPGFGVMRLYTDKGFGYFAAFFGYCAAMAMGNLFEREH